MWVTSWDFFQSTVKSVSSWLIFQQREIYTYVHKHTYMYIDMSHVPHSHLIFKKLENTSRQKIIKDEIHPKFISQENLLCIFYFAPTQVKICTEIRSLHHPLGPVFSTSILFILYIAVIIPCQQIQVILILMAACILIMNILIFPELILCHWIFGWDFCFYVNCTTVNKLYVYHLCLFP